MKPKAPQSGKSFAEELKEARNAAGLTQAEAAGVLRVARRAIQNWEEGKREPIYPAQLGVFVLLSGYQAGMQKQNSTQNALI